MNRPRWILPALLLAAAPVTAQPCPTYFAPVVTGVSQDVRVDEASGLAASVAEPGIYWVHNDSGDSARFFALREDGSTVATYDVAGIGAVDWEDMARGPGPVPGVSYLYFADIGDNLATRPFITVYRVPEPTLPPTPGATVALSGAVALEMVYPEAAHDAETLLVDPLSGDLFVITKCFPLSGCADGISRVYRYPFPHLDGVRVTLEEVASIAFTGTAFAHAATAGDISPSGNRIVVRTYSQALAWERAPGQTIADALSAPPCPVPLAAEPQGETIAFASDGASYSTLSEGALQPLQRIDQRFGDQTLAARSLTVRDRSSGADPAAPRLTATAKEVASTLTIAGDPTARGAVLEIALEGASPATQTFVLLPGSTNTGVPRWRALASGGFRYDDPDGEVGALARLFLKKSAAGTVVLRLSARAANGPLALLPPNAGTQAFVSLRFPAGDRYCIRYGADGHVRNDGAALFRVRGPTAEGCPP